MFTHIGTGLAFGFLKKYTDSVDTINTLADFSTYQRNGNTEVRVLDPIKGNYFDYSETNPYAPELPDGVILISYSDGGFFVRRFENIIPYNEPLIDPAWYGTILDASGNAVAGWNLTTQAAKKFQKNIINKDGYISLIPKRTDSAVPLKIPNHNLKLYGGGVFKANIINPTDYTEGYQILEMTGDNTEFWNTIDGGKDNSKLNTQPPTISLTYLAKFTGDGFHWRGKAINGQGYGFQTTGDNVVWDSIEECSNNGYAVNHKAYKNQTKFTIKKFRGSRQTGADVSNGEGKARTTVATLNVQCGANINGSENQGWFIDLVIIEDFEAINGLFLQEGATGGVGITGKGYFKFTHIYRFVASMHYIWTDYLGRTISGHNTKLENLENVFIDYLEIMPIPDLIQGFWFNDVNNCFDPENLRPAILHWVTNAYSNVLCRGKTTIGVYEFRRKSSWNPGSYYFFKQVGTYVSFEEIIINDYDITIRDNAGNEVGYNQSSFLFKVKNSDGSIRNTEIHIKKFTFLGTKNNKYRLQDGGAAGRLKFHIEQIPPSNRLRLD